MKNRMIILGFLLNLMGVVAFSQKYEIDFKNPESVLNVTVIGTYLAFNEFGFLTIDTANDY